MLFSPAQMGCCAWLGRLKIAGCSTYQYKNICLQVSFSALCCRIDTFLDNVDVGEYYVHGDLEAYSCESFTAVALQQYSAICLQHPGDGTMQANSLV